MKKGIVLFVLLGIFMSARAQITHFSTDNTTGIRAILSYRMAYDGFYYPFKDVSLKELDGIVEYYAYDKKTKSLYVRTENSNCVISLTKESGKLFKKNKAVPQLKDIRLSESIAGVNKALEIKFKDLNVLRVKHLSDSVARAKAIADSIARVRAEEERIAKIKRDKEIYRNTHRWDILPLNRHELECSLCSHVVNYEDSLPCIAIKNDTIYSPSNSVLAMGVSYPVIHTYPVTSSLGSDEKFRYHTEIFGDSLAADSYNITDDVPLFNHMSFMKALKELQGMAPYGFFNEWGWDNEYSFLTFNFTYVNMSKNTLKYIDVYWDLLNDVYDVRESGHFKGTGPVKQYDSGTWEWDNSSYYVAGDVTKMNIKKVIITYMNGTKKVLTKSMIKFN